MRPEKWSLEESLLTVSVGALWGWLASQQQENREWRARKLTHPPLILAVLL
jgi:hypothetical protein